MTSRTELDLVIPLMEPVLQDDRQECRWRGLLGIINILVFSFQVNLFLTFLKLLVLIDVTWVCQKFLTLVSDLVPLSYCHDLEPSEGPMTWL